MAFESDSYYTDKLSGKEVHLEAVQDVSIVTFDPAAAGDVGQFIRERGLTQLSFQVRPTLGFAIVEGNHGSDAKSHPLAGQAQVLGWTYLFKDQEGGRHYILPRRLDVRFQPGISAKNALAVIEQVGGRIVGRPRTAGFYAVTVPEGLGFFATVRAFSERPEVKFAVPSLVAGETPSPERPYEPCTPTPRHTGRHHRGGGLSARLRRKLYFHQLWALENVGQRICKKRGSKGACIRARDGWKVSLGSREVIIAVVDSGMDLEHPDLAQNLLPRRQANWNFTDESDPRPHDRQGHGTQLCGIAAASLKGPGIVGVAPQSRLMPLKVFLNDDFKSRADALYYLAAYVRRQVNRRFVINLSWVLSCDYTPVRDAITEVLDAGAVVVCSVSLGGLDMDQQPPTYPASYEGVLAVTATTANDQKGCRADYGSRVDVAAPGEYICTTDLANGYSFQSGTSFGAAHVAGLAALIWSVDETLTNEWVGRLIKESCDSIDSMNPGLEGKLGAGRINAGKAVRMALELKSLSALAANEVKAVVALGAARWLDSAAGPGDSPRPEV